MSVVQTVALWAAAGGPQNHRLALGPGWSAGGRGQEDVTCGAPEARASRAPPAAPWQPWVHISRRAPGRNPNPLKVFSQDLLNLRGRPQNPPRAVCEGDLSN